MQRRHFLSALAVPAAFAQTAVPQAPVTPAPRRGRIKQGITRGVFPRGMSMEDCCREAARLGIKGFDLIGPADWPTLKKYGLIPSMYPAGAGGTIPTRSIAKRITNELSNRSAPPLIKRRMRARRT